MAKEKKGNIGCYSRGNWSLKLMPVFEIFMANTHCHWSLRLMAIVELVVGETHSHWSANTRSHWSLRLVAVVETFMANTRCHWSLRLMAQEIKVILAVFSVRVRSGTNSIFTLTGC